MSTTPLSSGILVLVSKVGVDSGHDGGESRLVLGTNVSQSDHSSGLLVDESSQTSLTLDNGVRNVHLSAQSRQEHNQLNGVHIVGNEHKLGLAVLDQRNNVVETVLDNVRLLGHVLLLLALGNGSSLLGQTLLLLSSSLGAVLVQELESLSSSVLVQGGGELGKSRGDLETVLQDLLLSLQTDILGPLDETGEVSLGLDVLSNSEGSRSLLEQRVLLLEFQF